MRKGCVFILSGPSGSGKDTILKEILERRPDLFFSISSITREKRKGETDGEKYHFISREEFEEGLENHAFLEYNKYLDNYYGTPKAPVETHIAAGTDVLIEVDVNGARSIREKIPDAVSIFIMPPSLEVLKKRLSGRGTETETQIEKRLNAALEEIRRAEEYDYIVVNDALSAAVSDTLSVLNAAKLTLPNQKFIIDEVLHHA